jgi:tRNA(Ile)-lysidine synthase
MPDAVRRAVRSWLTQHLQAGAPVIIACSGGADSLALGLALVDCPGAFSLVGATVDHGLQAGSAARAAATASMLTDLGYPRVEVLTVAVDGPGGPEAAARRARYRALGDLAVEVAGTGPAAAVLLGHTLDDQAETVLLGLARGSGPRSIAGMRPWRPPWGRPLLGVRRSSTEAACRAAGLQPWQDPHNFDPAFTRVRLRREVVPLLDDVLGGGVPAALARTAVLMAQDLDALDEIAAGVAVTARGANGSLSIRELRTHPPAIRHRVLRSWAAAGGAGALGFDHLSRMAAVVADRAGPAQIRVPGGFDVVRVGDELALVRHDRETGSPGPAPAR